jgi:hypothetical protein
MTGLSICSVAPFKAVFMARLTKYTYLDATGDVTLSSMTCTEVLAKIKEVSTAAKAIYDHMNIGNKWNIPGKPAHHANIVNRECDNCGALDHLSPKCPEPRDEGRCKKAKEAHAKAKRDTEEGGRGGRGDCGGEGRGAGGGGERAPWNDENAKKGANSGVMKIEGIWKMNCSKCGWNESHTTKYHDKQSRNAASFKVPPHHPFWCLSGKIYQTAGSASVISALPGADAVSSGSRGSMLGSLTGVIDRAITSTKSSEMSSFLAEMREALGN